MKKLLVLTLMILSSITFASEKCNYHLMLKLDLDDALESQNGRDALLESNGRNRWKIQIYTQEQDSAAIDELVFDSQAWAHPQGSISLNTPISFEKVNGSCPLLSVYAIEHGYLSNSRTRLVTGIEGTESIGQKVEDYSIVSNGVYLWRNHRAGLNVIMLNTNEYYQREVREMHEDFIRLTP